MLKPELVKQLGADSKRGAHTALPRFQAMRGLNGLELQVRPAGLRHHLHLPEAERNAIACRLEDLCNARGPKLMLPCGLIPCWPKGLAADDPSVTSADHLEWPAPEFDELMVKQTAGQGIGLVLPAADIA